MKGNVKKLIQEAIEAVIEQDENTKQTLKANISKQIKILKFVKQVFNDMSGSEEASNIGKVAKKYDTAKFLQDVLGVDDAIEIRLSSLLESPLEAYKAVVDEIMSQALNKASQKLAEVERPTLDVLGRDSDRRRAKHQKKMMKKEKGKLPPLQLEDAVDEREDTVNENKKR